MQLYSSYGVSVRNLPCRPERCRQQTRPCPGFCTPGIFCAVEFRPNRSSHIGCPCLWRKANAVDLVLESRVGVEGLQCGI
jgi:hypothetical protein